MKKCELCKGLARTYCESDQASLCWTCDVKVHGANFLVARHSRSVLCHACQAPTPWKASGAELGVTVSVCERCVVGVRNRDEEEESQGGNDDEIETEDDDRIEDDDYDDGDDDEEEEDEDEGEAGGDDEETDNQVVPLSSTSTPPPPAASSSSSEESVSRLNNGGGEVSETATVFSLKRMRDTDLPSQVSISSMSDSLAFLVSFCMSPFSNRFLFSYYGACGSVFLVFGISNFAFVNKTGKIVFDEFLLLF